MCYTCGHQARSKAEITGGRGGEQLRLVKTPLSPPDVNKYLGHKAYENSRQIDTTTVHDASVRFHQKGHLYEDIVRLKYAKKLFPVCFFADKVVGNFHQIYLQSC